MLFFFFSCCGAPLYLQVLTLSFPTRRASYLIVAQLIDRRLCSPQMLFERGTFGRHGTEHKAAVTRYARYFSKADTGFRNAFVAIGQRIAHQVAGIRESQGMVGEDKRFTIDFLIGA